MEVAHLLSSVTVCQITSHESSRSKTCLRPSPKLRITHQPLKLKVSSRKIGPLVACATGSSGAGDDHEEDKRASIDKNRNIQELSHLIGEQTRSFCNFVSVLCPFLGNKQVVDFFSSLVRAIGKNIEFVIQPAPFGGMNVGVAWSLEWDKTHVPLGKGYSFYTSHWYKGKVIIRDAEVFIEPLIKGMKPIALGWTAIVRPIVERVSAILKHKRTRVFIYSLSTVVIMSILLTILKRPPL